MHQPGLQREEGSHDSPPTPGLRGQNAAGSPRSCPAPKRVRALSCTFQRTATRPCRRGSREDWGERCSGRPDIQHTS